MNSSISERKFSRSPSSPGSEPMNLGSPVSSPSSPNNSLNFLPSYLFTDGVVSSSPSHPQQNGKWTSPVKIGVNCTYKAPLSSQKSLFYSPPLSIMGSSNVTKTGGPPVEDLFMSRTSLKFSQENSFVEDNPKEKCVLLSSENDVYSKSILLPRNPPVIPISSALSPHQIDPFYSQGESLESESQLDELWVTVYGFPQASASFILELFSQYGKIIDYRLPTAGNWMHIKYQTKLQAKKAISKAGKTYANCIMVGVKPCINLDVFSNSESNNTSQFNASFSQNDSNSEDFSKLTKIRPLTKVFDTSVIDEETTTKIDPENSNIVRKAMEYVLKWGQE